MILQIDDWKFDIDMECTMAYSANEVAVHCDCAYCRNFYGAIDQLHPQLRPFLAQFGLDIEAPEEMLPVIDESILYDPTYKVFGRIIQQGSFEMQAGLCSIVAREEANDCFLLDCYEVFLPWTLNEPLEEVLSPANEPSLLQRMVQKIMGKAPTDSVNS